MIGLIVRVAGLSGTAIAGPLEDGHDSYDRGDLTVAMQLWRSLADQGHFGSPICIIICLGERHDGATLYGNPAEKG
jgi:hypothetical protein